MPSTPTRLALVPSVCLLALLIAAPPALAQDRAYEVPGIARGRAHQTLLPWESIDTLSGGIKLRFVDFELPGDGNAALAIERTYDSKWSGAVAKRWRFGLSGIPMEVTPSSTPQGDSVMVLRMSDGTEHLAPAYPAGQTSTHRTRELMTYRRGDNRLDLPSGLYAYYASKGSPSRLVLTEVHNVYGMVAKVTYDEWTGIPLRLATIQQFVADQNGNTSWTDGSGNVFGSRIVEFFYNADTDPQPSLVTMNGLEWTFTWNADWQLESATTLEGQQWGFTYSPAGTGWIDVVTTPNGATIDYDVANVERSWVGDNPDYPGQRVFTYTVTRRAVTDPRGSAGGTWTYQYDAPAAAFVTVHGPDGISQVFGYGYSEIPPEPFTPDVTVREVETWRNGVRVQRERFLRGVIGGDVTEEEVLTEHTIERDGRVHTTTYSQYDLYWGAVVKPSRSEIESDGAVGTRSRTTSRTLSYAFATQPFSGRYMGPLVTGVTVTNVGRDAGSAASSAEYDGPSGGNTGFKTAETVNGIRTTFEPDGRGNVWRQADANGQATTFTYAWGVVKNTLTPAYAIERVIDASGLMLEERRPNGSGWHTTTFDYDNDHRPTFVAPPVGYPVTTEYHADRVIVRRGTGQQETRYTLNGLGDVTSREDVVTALDNVRRERIVDAWGRVTFTSLPRYPRNGGTVLGTQVAFDGLHRVRWERDSRLVRVRTYQANGEVVIREYNAASVPDPDNIGAAPLRTTTQRYDAWGNPDDAVLRSVTDAEGGTFAYTYNAVGRLASVTSPGGVTRAFGFVPGKPDLVQSEQHPESGQTLYEYDAAGRRTKRTASDGRFVIYGYDGNGRLTAVDLNGTTDNQHDATFDYDSNDRRRFANNGPVQRTYQHDGAGRLRNRTDTVTGGNPSQTGTAVTTWDYDDRDNLTKITYPSGSVVEYGYDRANRLTRVTRDGVVMLDALEVHPSGALQRALLGSNLAQVATFDDRHRIDTFQAGKVNPAQAFVDLDYDYDPTGNTIRANDSRGATYSATFGYDRLDRLTTITGFNRPQSTIQYDALGNRSWLGGTYVVNVGTQRLMSRPNGTGTETFTYDDHGNVKSDAQGQYVYSPIDTLVRHTAPNGTVTTFTYDADGARAGKTTGGDSTFYVPGAAGEVLSEWRRVNGAAATWQRDYIYAGSRLLAAVTPAPPVSISYRVVCPGSPAGSVVTTCQVPEGVGSVVVRATVTTADGSAIRKAFTVPFATARGTAVSPADFTAATGAGTVAVGTASGTSFDLPIAIVQDTVDDPDPAETFTVRITPPAWVTTNTAVVTIAIADDDAGVPITLTLSPASQQVSEAAGTATVTLVLTTANQQPTARAVNILSVTANGSAVAGSDYAAVYQPLTIPAGTPHNTPISGPVQILNDTATEPLESFTVTVTTTTSDVTIPVPTQTIAILDDDTSITVGMASTAQTRWENDGSATLAMVITTGNGQPTSRPVTVRYQTVNGSAVAGSDFVAANSTYTFPAGTPSGTAVAGSAVLVNDTVVEATEAFSVVLTSETAGVGVSSATHTITLSDDDQIFVRFTAASSSVGEASGSAPLAVVVTTPRGTPTSRAITVSYATAGGSATQGLDYAGASGSFAVAAGTASGTPFGSAVVVVNDVMWEPAETFTVSIAAPGAAVDPPHTVTIVNDDTAALYAQVDLTTAGQAVWENAGAIWVSVVVTTYNGAPTTAAIPLTGRTVHEWNGANPATPGVDYQALGEAGAPPAVLTIAAGTPSGTLISAALGLANDPTDEPNEWLQFRVTPSGAASAVPLQGIWIYDDDPGPNGLRATGSMSSASVSGADTAVAATPVPPTGSRRAAPTVLGQLRLDGRQTYRAAALTWTAGTPR